jgi:hypothetical protein
MELLYSMHTPKNCVEFVKFNNKRFKIEIETSGSSYVYVYIQTNNGEFALVVNGSHLKGITIPHYTNNDEEKLVANVKNIKIAKQFIEKVFND